jgi:hypothetical protein
MLIPQVTVPVGTKANWSVERFEIKANSPGMTYLALKGRAIKPGTYTRLVHKDRGVIMSDVPAEVDDHRFFISAARGHVLINGLGIGMALNAILQPGRPVERVTVVEIDQDVIDLVADHYLKDERVEIVHADAFEYQPPKGIRYGAVWHDIWDEICSDNLDSMKTLHRRYGRRTDWQGSWGRWQSEEASRRYWR